MGERKGPARHTRKHIRNIGKNGNVINNTSETIILGRIGYVIINEKRTENENPIIYLFRTNITVTGSSIRTRDRLLNVSFSSLDEYHSYRLIDSNTLLFTAVPNCFRVWKCDRQTRQQLATAPAVHDRHSKATITTDEMIHVQEKKFKYIHSLKLLLQSFE